MDKLSAFITSGIIESYCLGFTSPEENLQVQIMIDLYPEVQQEIDKVKGGLDKEIFLTEIKPSPAVKFSLMHTIYTQQAGIHKKFIPLLNELKDFRQLKETIEANQLENTDPLQSDLVIKELPSTKEIVNFAAWAKVGQEEEIHHDLNEYIAIIKGSCEMYFDDIKHSYSEGDIIYIPPHVLHSAVVTSREPMFALVQRQMFVV